ncbi:hypothetical protein ABRP83_13655 [Pectobacterium brasiliense]
MKDLSMSIKLLVLGMIAKTISDLLDYSVTLTQDLIKVIAFTMWAAATYYLVMVLLKNCRAKNEKGTSNDEVL